MLGGLKKRRSIGKNGGWGRNSEATSSEFDVGAKLAQKNGFGGACVGRSWKRSGHAHSHSSSLLLPRTPSVQIEAMEWIRREEAEVQWQVWHLFYLYFIWINTKLIKIIWIFSVKIFLLIFLNLLKIFLSIILWKINIFKLLKKILFTLNFNEIINILFRKYPF